MEISPKKLLKSLKRSEKVKVPHFLDTRKWLFIDQDNW
jgi:hypothetical protein